jgi:hypothetical protein
MTRKSIYYAIQYLVNTKFNNHGIVLDDIIKPLNFQLIITIGEWVMLRLYFQVNPDYVREPIPHYTFIASGIIDPSRRIGARINSGIVEPSIFTVFPSTDFEMMHQLELQPLPSLAPLFRVNCFFDSYHRA